MTREEAIKKLFDVSSDLGLVETIEARIIIEEIFDDFESRVCKNCKHFTSFGKKMGIGICSNFTKNINVANDFGCNRFERREDEGD